MCRGGTKLERDRSKQLSFIDIEKDIVEDEELFLPKKESTELQETREEADIPLPLTLDEIVAKQYKEGKTLKEITKENGISYGKVYEILNRLNIPLRHGRYSSSDSGDRIMTMTQLEKKSLIADYKAGVPINEILKKYQINKHGCYSILDEAGVERRMKVRSLPINGVLSAVSKAGKTKSKSSIPLDMVIDGDTLRITIDKETIQSIKAITIEIK